MAHGFFQITNNPGDENDFIIRPIPVDEDAGAKTAPPEQASLASSIDRVLYNLRILYLENPANTTVIFKLYLNRLLNIAKLGLEGNNAQPEIAATALELLKAEIVAKEAGKIKNNYIKLLGRQAIILGIIPLLLGILYEFTFCYKPSLLCVQCLYSHNLLLIWAGCMVGVCLSFSVSKTEMLFEDLITIEKDRVEPKIRLILTGIVSLIFAYLFIKEALVVKLGKFSTEDIQSDAITAFIIGTFLGLNEKIIGQNLFKKTSNLFG
jgi:hypothetical protein